MIHQILLTVQFEEIKPSLVGYSEKSERLRIRYGEVHRSAHAWDRAWILTEPKKSCQCSSLGESGQLTPQRIMHVCTHEFVEAAELKPNALSAGGLVLFRLRIGNLRQAPLEETIKYSIFGNGSCLETRMWTHMRPSDKPPIRCGDWSVPMWYSLQFSRIILSRSPFSLASYRPFLDGSLLMCCAVFRIWMWTKTHVLCAWLRWGGTRMYKLAWCNWLMLGSKFQSIKMIRDIISFSWEFLIEQPRDIMLTYHLVKQSIKLARFLPQPHLKSIFTFTAHSWLKIFWMEIPVSLSSLHTSGWLDQRKGMSSCLIYVAYTMSCTPWVVIALIIIYAINTTKTSPHTATKPAGHTQYTKQFSARPHLWNSYAYTYHLAVYVNLESSNTCLSSRKLQFRSHHLTPREACAHAA